MIDSGGNVLAQITRSRWIAVLDGKSYTVAGVLPPGFHFLADADVFTPLRPDMPAIYGERSVDAIGVLAR